MLYGYFSGSIIHNILFIVTLNQRYLIVHFSLQLQLQLSKHYISITVISFLDRYRYLFKIISILNRSPV